MSCDITIKSSLLDEPISIKLSSLTPGKKVRVVLSTLDAHKQDWKSEALFLADKQGELDISSANALSGTYSGVDPEGLFWSMQPLCDAKSKTLFTVSAMLALVYELSVYQGKQCIGKKLFSRSVMTPQIERIEIDEPNVTGVLFLPQQSTNCSGLVMVPGSGGVISLESTAALLASKGYAVLIVGYYRYKQLADELYELPLERFRDAISWFKKHERVSPDKVIAMGYSKGAESLLATLAYFSDVSLTLKGVVLHSPTNVVWQGMGRGKPKRESSWSLFNEPLSFLPYRTNDLRMTIIKKKLLALLFPRMSEAFCCVGSYKKALSNKRDEDAARIPIEQVKAPILFISGKNDCLWPSTWMADRMIDQLKENHFPYFVKHVSLPGMGHVIRHPGLPTTVSQIVFGKLTLEMGGQPQIAAQSYQIYWNELLQFIQKMMTDDQGRNNTNIRTEQHIA